MILNRFSRRQFVQATGGALMVPRWASRAGAADVPATLADLWAGFDSRREPLDVEVLKEWERDGVVCRIVRYVAGVFKGTPSRIAAFYAFPQGGMKLPALLDLHGGGQSASLDSVVTYARRGYATLSINWGGNPMNLGRETWSGPQTDWGRLDATHPPQRNRVNHFAGPLTPDDFTLDATDPAITIPPANWRTVTEFSLSPSGTVLIDGLRVKVGGKAWQGPREIRNLRWELGG